MKNRPRNSAQFKQFGAPLALFRERFESDSRQFKSNSRQLALWLTPSLNPAHLAKIYVPQASTTPKPPALFEPFLRYFFPHIRQSQVIRHQRRRLRKFSGQCLLPPQKMHLSGCWHPILFRQKINPLAPYLPFVNIRFNYGGFVMMWRGIRRRDISRLRKWSYLFMIILFAPVVLVIGLPFFLTDGIKNPVLRNILMIILYIIAVAPLMFLLPVRIRPFFR